jgi:nucleotide-binding universal stress UspA family protein
MVNIFDVFSHQRFYRFTFSRAPPPRASGDVSNARLRAQVLRGSSREAFMTTRILAVIAEAATASACLDAAEAAAQALQDATIEALHVIVDPRTLIAPSEEISYQELRERYEGSAQQRAANTYRAFERWLNFHAHPAPEIPLRWKEIAGAEQRTLINEAKDFDILVLARAKNVDGVDALHAAIYETGLPFILVPSEWRLVAGNTFAERIVVAWNGTRACSKAVLGASPWLQEAKDIIVLIVEDDGTSIEFFPETLAVDQAQIQIKRVKRDRGEPLGSQLLNLAHAYSADLLVMGVYRHNQFIEWLVGNTTRQVFANMDLPLIGAH